MKTFLMILALLEIALLASGRENKFSYVITNNDTLYCQNVVAGTANLNCVLQSGEKVKIPYNAVQTFFDGQTIKSKLPVYVNGKQTGKLRLMELIGCENGIFVYKYENFSGTTDSMDIIINYYDKTGYLNSQANPDLYQVKNSITTHGSKIVSVPVPHKLLGN
jgi:hypothetical protein